jgi:hypothetical protein
MLLRSEYGEAFFFGVPAAAIEMKINWSSRGLDFEQKGSR